MSANPEHDAWRKANERRIRQQVADALVSGGNPDALVALDAVMAVVQPMVDLIHTLLGPPIDVAELRRRFVAPRVDAGSYGGQMTCGRCGQTWTLPQTAPHVCQAAARV